MQGECIKFGEKFVPVDQKSKYAKAKMEILSRKNQDPKTIQQDCQKLAEDQIPEQYKKGYDLAKKLAMSDEDSLKKETIRIAEDFIPQEHKPKYREAKWKMELKLAEQEKAKKAPKEESELENQGKEKVEEMKKKMKELEKKKIAEYQKLVEMYIPQEHKAKYKELKKVANNPKAAS